MPTISMFYGILIYIHEEELLADWKLAVTGQPLFRINPLS